MALHLTLCFQNRQRPHVLTWIGKLWLVACFSKEVDESPTATVSMNCGSKPGSAATATVAPSKFVETFAVDVSQTLEEHTASHNFPMHVKTCGPCRFWKHRVQWSASCSATNPVTLKKETWLGHAGCGFGVCLFCAAYRGSRCRSDLGRGKGGFSRLQNIVRHTRSKDHQEAEAAWKERVRAEGGDKFSEAATDAPDAPVFVRKAAPNLVAAQWSPPVHS